MTRMRNRGEASRSHHGRARSTATALALLAAALPAGLAAQARPDSVVPLEGVVVSTVRAATTTGGSSAVTVQPDSLHVVPAPTLEEVLRELPFVAVRENSRGEAEITVRGSESRQVAVLLDGIPLTLGWDHRTDPGVVPITAAQRITLIRGLHSVLYGPNVLGGVVEVEVAAEHAPSMRPRLQLRAGVDQYGAQGYSASGGRTLELATGDLLLRAGAGYRDRPAVALPRGVPDPASTDPDLRGNSDLRHWDAFAAGRYRALGGAWLGLSTSAYRAERGVPQELHVAEPRLWRYPDVSRLVAVASGGTGHRRTPWGVGDLEASLGVDVGRTEIHSYASSAYREVEEVETGDDRTLTLRLLGDHTLRTALLTGTATYADVEHDEVVDGAASAYRQRLWSVAGEVAVPLAGSTRLSGGIALDGADTPETGDKPPLGALRAWGGRLGASTLALDGRARLHAALSRRARFPSLRELYSGSLGRFEPNPELDPETLLGVEAGGTVGLGALQLQAVGFHHRLSDAIVRVAAGGSRFRRENRDQIRSTGVELLGAWSRGRASLTADLLLQRVRVRDPATAGGERRAEHQPELRAGVTAEAPLPLRLRALLSGSYTGEQLCVHPDRGALVSLEGSGRADLGVQRSWPLRGAGPLRSLRTTVSLDNVGDAATYDQCGLPQPGRTLRFAVELG